MTLTEVKRKMVFLFLAYLIAGGAILFVIHGVIGPEGDPLLRSALYFALLGLTIWLSVQSGKLVKSMKEQPK